MREIIDWSGPDDVANRPIHIATTHFTFSNHRFRLWRCTSIEKKVILAPLFTAVVSIVLELIIFGFLSSWSLIFPFISLVISLMVIGIKKYSL